MKATLTLGCAVLALLALGGPAAAQETGDTRIADEISRAVHAYVHFTIFDDISVGVENGDVLLRGKVTMPYKKEELEKRIAKIEGVRRIRNEIGVLPASRFDDDLRYRVARAIYGSPSFWSYAARAHPPIHIVVEHGRVTLTGVVSSNVERALARSLATGLGELSVTNELRTDVEVRTEARASGFAGATQGAGVASCFEVVCLAPLRMVSHIRKPMSTTAARNAPANSHRVR